MTPNWSGMAWRWTSTSLQELQNTDRKSDSSGIAMFLSRYFPFSGLTPKDDPAAGSAYQLEVVELSSPRFSLREYSSEASAQQKTYSSRKRCLPSIVSASTSSPSKHKRIDNKIIPAAVKSWPNQPPQMLASLTHITSLLEMRHPCDPSFTYFLKQLHSSLWNRAPKRKCIYNSNSCSNSSSSSSTNSTGSSTCRSMVLRTLLLLLLMLMEMQLTTAYRRQGYMQQEQQEKQPLTVGLLVPKSSFYKRAFSKSAKDAVAAIRRKGQPVLSGVNFTDDHLKIMELETNPSPKAILDTLCEKFLPSNVSAIIFLTNTENYGSNTASAQYFLQLAGYLGLPVISWNADNSGLEQAAQSGLRLQLAPSVYHQAAAMLSILVRYQWHAFTIVTSQIAGHTDFVQAVRDEVTHQREKSQGSVRFTVIDTVIVSEIPSTIAKVASSEARVLLLYSTREEASNIMKEAEKQQLTGHSYVWIVTQSVICDITASTAAIVPSEFPVGMLGVHFDTNTSVIISNIATSIEVFVHGVESFLNETRFEPTHLNPQISCKDQRASKWTIGNKFHRHLKDVSISQQPVNLSFNQDGTRRHVELKIMNLRNDSMKRKVWEEIGVWRSWDGLLINDIVWPGQGHVPPPGVPEQFPLKIAFLEEPPYITMVEAEAGASHCSSNRGVQCKIPAQPDKNETLMCCSGFCIDLLKKFAHDLGFVFELERVEDGKWGTLDRQKKSWNGLIGELLKRDQDKADLALTSLKMNKERETVVDFTVPFLESGIAIVVAKRTGIISPTAFLEPFDTASWMLVAFVAIQVAALTIFLFEWLSPGGYNMRTGHTAVRTFDQKMAPPRDHKFSLFRTYWLVWAVLFQAAVHVDCPRGLTARFMANMWAMFAVVFLAIYTANLAAFMITREEFHDFSGINDTRLQHPFTVRPPYKFGTVPETNSASVIRMHHPDMWQYMNKGYHRPSVSEGIKSIKANELDAFIYDATVLDYLVGQDDDCQILTVGSWYAMTGYGLAFPRGSKYLEVFNEKLMEYKDNGDIERLQRFWLTGTCKPKKQQRIASEPLAIEQFLSAYLLLGIGMVLAMVLLAFEHIYFKYIRKHLAKRDSGGCCALVSLSMGKSLTFRGAVYEAQDKLRRHRCRDPLCDTHIWKVKHELDLARMRIKQLEKELEAHGYRPSTKKFFQSRSIESSHHNVQQQPVCPQQPLQQQQSQQQQSQPQPQQTPHLPGHMLRRMDKPRNNIHYAERSFGSLSDGSLGDGSVLLRMSGSGSLSGSIGDRGCMAAEPAGAVRGMMLGGTGGLSSDSSSPPPTHPYAFHQPLVRKRSYEYRPVSTEIAEIETVL
ncbi:glutamate receptor ionotropic, NMDA 2B-like isoform X2 [Oratosquilla oratoria]|uniref:glutamate receptor ionotropic, NMDA 2B-like isoform X2 n=1 Tax=Oratosquilla oratoria TaxID=337810 RepID=UPI003F7660EF